MSTLGTAGRVGLAVILGAALLIGMFTFFNGGGVFSHTYTLDVLYDNVDGITPDIPVELAGVQIGQVKRVSLTPAHRADLTLEIKDKIGGQKVQIPKGSHFEISTPIIGGTGVIMIVPPADSAKHPTDTIAQGATDLVGTRTGDVSAALTHADALLDQLTVVTKNANALLADQKLRSSLTQTVDNLDEASKNGLLLTKTLNRTIPNASAEALGLLKEDNVQIQSLLRQTQGSSRVALDNLVATTTTVRGETAENRGKLNEIVANLRDTTAAVAGLTQQANNLLSSGGISKNLSATVANLNASSEKFNAIAGNFQNLTGDPSVQANLKGTVQNLHDTTLEAKYLLQRLNKLAGTKEPAASVIVAPGAAIVVPPLAPGTKTPTLNHSTATVPLILPRVDLIQNLRASHFRADLDAVVPLKSSKSATTSFVRGGIYGFGDSNKLDLQGGNFLAPGSILDYRAGLYASKLSVGGDLGLGRRETLSFDFYDPNTSHLDAHGVFMLSPALGLLVGGEDLTRRSGAVVGLEYRSTK